MAGHVTQLGSLTGLDDETVREQIVPYLETFTSKQALVNHLETLLGPGPSQKAFIESYTSHRFPGDAAPAAARLPAPPDPTYSAEASAPVRAGQARKTKAKFPTKLLPPRKVNAGSFGEIGSVYRKVQEEDALFASSSNKRTATLVEDVREAEPVKAASPLPAPTLQGAQAAELEAELGEMTRQAAGSASPALPQLAPTSEIKELQETIALLRGDSKQDPVAKAKPCFCQGRRHPLHPLVPLCLSCGLILCSILSPSPMLLPSPPCPSCASPLLSTTSRAITLTQLDLKVAALIQVHEERAQLIREERQKAWKEKRQEVELFPDLQPQHSFAAGGGTSATSSSVTMPAGSSKVQEYNYFYERRRAMDIAMGRKVEEDGQRKSRVLRLDTKGSKVKTGKKKKQQQQQISHQGKVETGKVPPTHQAGRLQTGSPAVTTSSVPDETSHSEPEDEEAAAKDYVDSDVEGHEDWPAADPDDDGFARHASSFPPAPHTRMPPTLGWWEAVDYDLPPIRYVAKGDRVRAQAEEHADEEEGEQPPRMVPGSEQKTSGPTNGGRKGKKAAVD